MPVNMDFVFQASMAFALFGWIALALAPLNRGYAISFARCVALVLAVTYLAQLIFTTKSVEGGDFMSLDGITLLFSNAPNVMLGWSHYLAFDLFIGSWEAQDAAERGVPHWLLIPCLVLTLMVGPVGLLVYYLVRIIWQQARKGGQAEPQPAL